MTFKEFEVLQKLASAEKKLSQRELARETGFSVGTVNTSSRIANDSSGVGRNSSKRNTLKPFEAKMSATRSAKERELLRES